jgi:hypothetical protein
LHGEFGSEKVEVRRKFVRKTFAAVEAARVEQQQVLV